MILTGAGFVEFVEARELVEVSRRPRFAFLKDGQRYTVRSVKLVGVARVRIDAERDTGKDGWSRPNRASLLRDRRRPGPPPRRR